MTYLLIFHEGVGGRVESFFSYSPRKIILGFFYWTCHHWWNCFPGHKRDTINNDKYDAVVSKTRLVKVVLPLKLCTIFFKQCNPHKYESNWFFNVIWTFWSFIWRMKMTTTTLRGCWFWPTGTSARFGTWTLWSRSTALDPSDQRWILMCVCFGLVWFGWV